MTGSYGDGPRDSRPARARADRGHPPLRGSLARRGVDRRPGPLLPRQRRRWHRAARGGAERSASGASCSRRPPRSTVPPASTPIPEDAPLDPINPYGETKRTFEGALRWYGVAYGLRSVALRYFNVAGASERNGEQHDSGDAPDPECPRGGRGRPAADRLRDRLPDPRRDERPRLYPRRGSRRRPSRRARGDRPGRPPDERRRAPREMPTRGPVRRPQPRQRRRVQRPRGHRRGRARRRAGHPDRVRAAPRRRPTGPRGRQSDGPARSSAGRRGAARSTR